MRIVRKIFGSFRRGRREDSVFGHMLYMGDRLHYWEGRAIFPPTSSAVEVFVEGSLDDTLEHQHEFFHQLAQEWQNLSPAIKAALSEKVLNLDLNNVILSSISIPHGSIQDSEWELSFHVPSQPGRLFTVKMRGRIPQGLLVDG